MTLHIYGTTGHYTHRELALRFVLQETIAIDSSMHYTAQ